MHQLPAGSQSFPMSSWQSMLTIYVFGAVVSIICFLPSFCGWKFNYDGIDPKLAPVTESINSLEFKYSLISCVSVSIPMIVDFIIDSIITSKKMVASYRFSRGVLLLSLFLPDLLMFSVAQPERNLELLVCLFQWRALFISCTLLASIVNARCKIMPDRAIIIFSLLCGLSFIEACYASFFKIPIYVSYLIYILSSFGGAAFIYRSCKLYIKMRKIPWEDITTEQCSRILYLIVCNVLLLIDFAMSILHGFPITAQTTNLYFTSRTLFAACATIVIYIVEGHIHRVDVYRSQKVTNFKIFISFSMDI